MPVVSDASPLILLAKIRKLDFLKKLYLEVLIPLHANTKDILVDDKLARVAARILRLKAIGCLGVVMKAYEAGIIGRSEASDTIQNLVKAGLWISPEVLGEGLTSLKV